MQEETEKKTEKLSLASDTHAGLEILHTFVLDMLGRGSAVARIFESTAEEDFSKTQVVKRRIG